MKSCKGCKESKPYKSDKTTDSTRLIPDSFDIDVFKTFTISEEQKKYCYSGECLNSISQSNYTAHSLKCGKSVLIAYRDSDSCVIYSVEVYESTGTIDTLSMYENGSYSACARYYRNCKKGNSDKQESRLKIERIVDSKNIGYSAYSVSYYDIFYGISIKDIMTHYYFQSLNKLDDTAKPIVEKIRTSAEFVDKNDIFAFNINGSLLACPKHKPSIKQLCAQYIYFNFYLYPNAKYSNTCVIDNAIEKCARQIISYILHDTFVPDTEDEVNEFEEPIMIIDCLKSHLQKIKFIVDSTDDLIFKYNYMIKIIEKNIKRETEKPDSESKQVPFIIENVSTLRRDYWNKRRLTSDIDIYNFHRFAVTRWKSQDIYTIIDFYDKLMIDHTCTKNNKPNMLRSSLRYGSSSEEEMKAGFLVPDE